MLLNNNDSKYDLAHSCDFQPPGSNTLPGNAFVYWTMLLLGVSVLFTSSALIAAGDYYEEVFGKTRVVFIAPLVISISSPFVQAALVYLQSYFTYTSRIVVCYTINGIMAFMLPIVISLDVDLGYSFLILTFVVVGVSNAILKATILSLAAMFPPEYTHAVMLGKGLSSIIVAGARIGVKLIFNGGREDTERGAMVFFGLATLLALVSVVCFRITRRTFFSRYYFPSFRLRRAGVIVNADALQHGGPQVCCTVCGKHQHIEHQPIADVNLNNNMDSNGYSNGYNNMDTGNTPLLLASDFTENSGNQGAVVGDISGLSLNVGNNVDSGITNIPEVDTPVTAAEAAGLDSVSDAIDSGLNHEGAHVAKGVVFRKIAYELWLVFIMFVITFLAFPGLAQKTPPSWALDKAWTNILMIAIFGVADFFGRLIKASWISKYVSQRACAGHIYIRIFIYAGYVYSGYIHALSSEVIVILTILMGFSNGYLCVLVVNYPYPRVLTNEKATAGALVSTTIVAGVLVGSLIAMCVDAIFG